MIFHRERYLPDPGQVALDFGCPPVEVGKQAKMLIMADPKRK